MDHSKQKAFTYWRVRFDPEPFGKSMQQLLNETFDETSVKDRQYKTSEDAPYFQFINQKNNIKGFFCANLLGYEQGKMEQIIKANFEKDYIETRALEAGKGDDGTDQHFLDGKLYFICFGDHVILSQDARIKAVHLERYLHDKIVEMNPNVTRNLRFSLERSIPIQTRKKIENVKRIELTSMLQGDKGINLKTETALVKRTFGLARVAGVLKELMGSDVSLDNFPTKGIIEDNEIQVTVALKWATRKHGETVADQLDTFANVFRHVEDELEVKIETGSGTYRNEELRLETKRSVRHRDDMPLIDDIFDKMIGWYDYLNAEKQI
jgi:hypothetical protein